MSDREALDLFLGDMAAHQRVTGREVTAEANRGLAVPEFEKLDADGTFAAATKTVATPPDPVLPDERPQTSLDGWHMTQGADAASPLVAQSPAERAYVTAALRRIKMLLELQDSGIAGAPSWSARARSVFCIPPAHPKFAHELAELLDASSAMFGDWRREDERKVIIT